MKKIVTILSLTLIVVLATGSYFFYTCYLNSYKQSFKAYIIKNNTHLLTTKVTIDAAELYINTKIITWEDDNQEIEFNGKLYDIVSISNKNKKVTLTILSDNQEQDIKKEFAANYNDDISESNTQKPFKLLKQFLSLKFITSNTMSALLISNNVAAINATFYWVTLPKVCLSPETPPPIFFK